MFLFSFCISKQIIFRFWNSIENHIRFIHLTMYATNCSSQWNLWKSIAHLFTQMHYYLKIKRRQTGTTKFQSFTSCQMRLIRFLVFCIQNTIHSNNIIFIILLFTLSFAGFFWCTTFFKQVSFTNIWLNRFIAQYQTEIKYHSLLRLNQFVIIFAMFFFSRSELFFPCLKTRCAHKYIRQYMCVTFFFLTNCTFRHILIFTSLLRMCTPASGWILWNWKTAEKCKR